MTDSLSSQSPSGKVVLIVLAMIGVSVFFYFDAQQYLTLESLKLNRDQLLAYTRAYYLTAVFLFVCIYCVQTAFSLPGATILTLCGGLLFGSVLGAVYVNVAATLGATLAFLAARYLLRDWVEQKFRDRLEPIQQGVSKNAFSYLLTLRLVPLFPFFLVNLVSGLTRVSTRMYVLATSIGIIPGSFVYANAGQQLGTINSLGEIASPQVLGAFVLLSLFAVLPIVYQRLGGKREMDSVKE